VVDMDIWGYVLFALFWLIPICAVILFWPKVKRMMYHAVHKNYIVCHMFAEVGDQLMEVRTNLVPIGARHFRNDKADYIVIPDQIMWRPTGILGGLELHLYYLIGRRTPISFSKIKDDKSAVIAHDTMRDTILHNFLTSEIPKPYLYIIIGLIIVAAVLAIALAWILLQGGGTTAITPPR